MKSWSSPLADKPRALEPQRPTPTHDDGAFGFDDPLAPPASIALIAPGYGGIRVQNASTPTEGVLRLMAWCQQHASEVEATLVAYGILLAVFPDPISTSVTHVRREDGLTLAFPDLTSSQAFTQLTQAFLAFERGPLRDALREAAITPYRT